jgi:hypothetical protein
MSDLGSLVSSVAAVEAGPGRLVCPSFLVPAADGSAEAGGSESDLVETERAVWEPLSPDQFEPVQVDEELPVTERIVNALGQIWDQIELADAVSLVLLGAQYQATMGEVVINGVKRAEYLEALGMAYSEYVRDSLWGYVELFKIAGKAIARGYACQMAVFDFGTDLLLGAVTGTIDFDAILVELQAQCPELIEIVSALAQLHGWFVVLRDNPLDVLLAVAELLGELIVAVLEVIRDKDIIASLREFATDHVAIGEIHGLLLGVVIADIVIDELLTLGAGKAAKGIRWLVRAAP